MKKTLLSTAVALSFAATGVQAVTFNFDNSTSAGVQGTDFNYTCNTGNMNAGKEFRMCDPNGALGGGLPAKKDTINGSEQWMFSGGVTGLMTGVANTNSTAGISATVASYVDAGYVLGSADRNGGLGLDQGADFFGANFGFLAPIVGEEANTGAAHANDVGVAAGVYTATSATTFTVFFATLEAQWNGTHFSLGRDSGGITFAGTTDGTNFSMWAEELIDPSEDNGAAGFGGWTAEWYYVGTLDGFTAPGAPAVPVPAAVWLFGSGLLGLVGVARRKAKA